MGAGPTEIEHGHWGVVGMDLGPPELISYKIINYLVKGL
jgi:hypothetical protein